MDRSIDHNKVFRFGRAIVAGVEQAGIVESVKHSGLDVCIHISKRPADEDRLMAALQSGGIITTPFASFKIERAV